MRKLNKKFKMTLPKNNKKNFKERQSKHSL